MTEKVKEFCSNCCQMVELDAQFDTPQQCPECGYYLFACSLCEGGVCQYCKRNKKVERMNRKFEF